VAIAWNKVKQEVANLLGAVLGPTAVDTEGNYTSPISTSTVNSPDWAPTQIEDALVMSLGRIAEAIASTALHPERARFTSQTASLASGALIPRTDSGGTNVVIGVIGTVRDASNSTVLLPVDVDKVRSFNLFSSTVYNGFACYWYAVDGQRILHTRTNVVIDVCTYTRPSSFAGDVPLDDYHEGGLVAGAVEILALKESQFADLYGSAKAASDAHLAQIRAYGNGAGYGIAQAAPSPT
jgi:hypothetical protein